MNRAFPALYIPTSCLGPGLSRPTLKEGDWGYPPSFLGFVRGGSGEMRPLLTPHKKASLTQSTQTKFVPGKCSCYGVAFYFRLVSSVCEGTGPSRHPNALLPRAGP